MFGSFSDDLLEQFKQDYAERYDFAQCKRPDGTIYGTKGKCQPPAREVSAKKKKEAEKMCVQYQPWQIPALRMQMVPCRTLGVK